MNKSIQSFDPSNGELLGEVNQTSAEEVTKTIRKAKAAQKAVSYTHLTLPTMELV